MPGLGVDEALRLTGVLAGVTLGIDSLELAVTSPVWLRHPLRAPARRRVPELASDLTVRFDDVASVMALAAVAARLLAAVVLIAGLSSLMLPACLAGLAASFALSLMSPLGTEGSDHMVPVLLLGLGAAALLNDAPGHAIGAWFIALQACLAYSASGIAKLFGVEWRRGTALATIMSTGWGASPRVGSAFTGHAWLSKAVSWSTVGYEVLFPLVLFVPAPMAIAILAGGVLLHLGIALTMGLNVFFWAFVATYPVVAACSLSLGVH